MKESPRMLQNEIEVPRMCQIGNCSRAKICVNEFIKASQASSSISFRTFTRMSIVKNVLKNQGQFKGFNYKE